MTRKFKQTEIGKIPEDWEIKRLSSFCNILMGQSPPSSTYNINSKGLPFFQGRKDFSQKYPIETMWCSVPTRIAKKGDVLLSVRAPVGDVNVAKEKCCIGRGLAALSMKNGNNEFLYYLIFSNKEALKGIFESEGTVFGCITKDGLHDFEVVVPKNESEQRAIAKILSDLDEKIELNRQMNKTLESIAQAIFKHWFVDFEFPIDIRRQPAPSYSLSQWEREGVRGVSSMKGYKSSGGKMIESKLGKIPEEWRMGRLEELIVNFDSERVPLSSRERLKQKGAYPYYGASSIMDYVDDYLFDGVYVLMAEDGSVIDDNGLPILQYVWGKFWVNNHTHVLQGKEGIPTEFILLLLQHTNVQHVVTGAVQPKINQLNMNNLEITIPPKNLILSFYDSIRAIYARYRDFIEENILLSTIRDSLLPKLMSGKIRVKNDI